MSSAPEVVVDATKAAEEAVKMEDTAAAAAAAASQQANTDAAIAAAAAAAAVTAVEVAPATPTGDGIAQPRVSLLADVDGQGKRRFFPRVKHLIGNKEWEDVSSSTEKNLVENKKAWHCSRLLAFVSCLNFFNPFHIFHHNDSSSHRYSSVSRRLEHPRRRLPPTRPTTPGIRPLI